MKLSQIKSILASRQIQLTKSLGQNFLHDQNQLDRIVAAADLAPKDRILEIGPGLGPLTVALLEKGSEVLAIEKDRRLFQFLGEQFAGHSNLTLLHDDALQYVRQRQDWSGWKVVSNLPYSVASPILVELAQTQNGPDRIVATLQWEVAQRLMASPADSGYGLLTVLVQLTYLPVTSFKIPASCFFPPPDVTSACIVLSRRSDPLLPIDRRATFQKIVKAGFSQRRKMMVKLLKPHWPEAIVQNAFSQLGISLQVRAEQLSLHQFVELTRILA